MRRLNLRSWWGDFLALPNDALAKTLGVTLLVAAACSLIVSFTAVALKPRHDANRLADRVAHIAGIADLLGGGLPDARFVDLATGAYADRDPGTRTAVPDERDLAGLGEREDVATVFELREGGTVTLVILPVRGTGYQSTLKAYLALKGDLNTVAALIFYEQGETPGLGSRIAEPAWQALWQGKRLADAEGTTRIEVAPGTGTGVHQVDAISGATRTSTGVTRLLRFWLGPDGYGPYLQRLRSARAR